MSLGLEPGDRVGIWSPNNAEWVITQFATAKADLNMVNINPAYRLAELEYVLNKVGCRSLITADAYLSSDYILMLRELMPELNDCSRGTLKSATFPTLEILIHIGEGLVAGMTTFDKVGRIGTKAGSNGLEDVSGTLQFDDAINIQFTSGTTGSPKGATLTHLNILNNGFFVGETLQLCEDDKVCIPVSLYHCFGMVLGNIACITHRAAMVFPGVSFSPLDVLETVTEERCTGLYGVPTSAAPSLNILILVLLICHRFAQVSLPVHPVP